jgi:hypothetical protein
MAHKNITNDIEADRAFGKFLKKYRAHGKFSDKKVAKYHPPQFAIDLNYYENYMTTQYEYESVIAIEISVDELRRLVDDNDMIDEISQRYGPNAIERFRFAEEVTWQSKKEARIRNANPAVQLAWEKYQMLLKIAGE